MSDMKKSLKQRAAEMSTSLPIMEGKTKGDTSDLIGTIVTIDNFDFLNGDNGKFAVFTVKEDPDLFYFGGMVLSDHLTQLADDGYLEEIQKEGLPMLLTKKKSKNKQMYTNVTFYPEDK